MTLTALLNRPVTLIARAASGDDDEYGNDKPDETLTATVCELQQRVRDEPDGGQGAAGEISRTDWLLILPAGTPARTGDAAFIDGQIYELVGDPWIARNPRTQQVSHIECTVRRTAGADDENPGS